VTTAAFVVGLTLVPYEKKATTRVPTAVTCPNDADTDVVPTTVAERPLAIWWRFQMPTF
jgi:hypothetical protein